MKVDWNIEEVNELRRKAGAYSENGAITRHLEHLELHLKTHEKLRSFELRKKAWESVEDWAGKLARLLERSDSASRGTSAG